MIKSLITSIGFLAVAGSWAFLGHAPGSQAGHSSSQSRVPPAARRDHPVLVELFQSQGCSDCPPANANLNAIADRPGLVVLSFGVTYWDYLGWKDTFATPQNTQRQWDYARYNHRGNVATPQVWIDGRTTIVGNDAQELARVINAAGFNGPALAVSGRQVRVGASAAPTGGADVWAAWYDPRVVQVPIRAGENDGRTLPHKNIVRTLVKVGRWNGRAASFRLPEAHAGLSIAVFLQAGRGGPILAAAKGS